MNIELKIKAKHLALEPDIIRYEEDKLKDRIKHTKAEINGADNKLNNLNYKLNSLITHRRWNVCNEARATHLARTYLDNKPYIHAEKKRKKDREYIFEKFIIPRITAMVKKYGTSEQTKADDKLIKEWSKI